jgi:hypothetical protein
MTETANATDDLGQGGRAGWAVWTAGLVVVIAAGAATAHGLYVVALGSGTPAGIAWLYPVITDGLALVAYAATSRLAGPGRRYAWAVVVLAAGLSGLAQATYLAGALPPATPSAASGAVAAAPPVLRFGVGAWPAVAAAIAAHLLFLISARPSGVPSTDPGGSARVPSDVPARAVPGVSTEPVPQAALPSPTDPASTDAAAAEPVGADGRRVAVSQTERARAVARALAEQTGSLPTVRELAEAAEVGRGTADRALTTLRAATNGHPTRAETPEDGPDPSQGAFWEPDQP